MKNRVSPLFGFASVWKIDAVEFISHPAKTELDDRYYRDSGGRAAGPIESRRFFIWSSVFLAIFRPLQQRHPTLYHSLPLSLEPGRAPLAVSEARR
jgi:hypothetical protein